MLLRLDKDTQQSFKDTTVRQITEIHGHCSSPRIGQPTKITPRAKCVIVCKVPKQSWVTS